MISCLPISNTYLVDTQLLRTFVTVATLGSFSAAAAELGYTQAAVSQQIASLEGDLKTRLLNRRPVVTTEAGARLLEHAEPILFRLDAARADVSRMSQTPTATLGIGVTALAGADLALATALATLRGRNPRLAVTVTTGPRLEVAMAVARGDLDLGLTDGLVAPGDPLRELVPLTAVGLSRSDVAAILPVAHPLAVRRALGLAELADARWIQADNVAPPLAEIRRLAGLDGFKAAFRYSGHDTLSLLSLVAAGHGLTLLPVAAARSDDIVAVRLATPRLCHSTELIHAALPQRSPAAELRALLNATSRDPDAEA
jgi:DNA-binding transcriptional LysR family regulator